MMDQDIAKHLIDTPTETLVDTEEEPDIEMIKCITDDFKVYVEFDSRLMQECPKLHNLLEIVSYIT